MLIKKEKETSVYMYQLIRASWTADAVATATTEAPKSHDVVESNSPIDQLLINVDDHKTLVIVDLLLFVSLHSSLLTTSLTTSSDPFVLQSSELALSVHIATLVESLIVSRSEHGNNEVLFGNGPSDFAEISTQKTHTINNRLVRITKITM